LADVIGIDAGIVYAVAHGVVLQPRADRLIDAGRREIDRS